MAGGGIIRALFGDLTRTIPMALKAASPYLEAGGDYVFNAVSSGVQLGGKAGWAAVGKGLGAMRQGGFNKAAYRSAGQAVRAGTAEYSRSFLSRTLRAPGGLKYMALGGVGWAITGDSNFMLLGAGMAAGNKGLLAAGKRNWAASSMIGMGIGIASGDPSLGAVSAVGLKGLSYGLGRTFGRRGMVGAGQLAKGMGQALLGNGQAAATTLSTVRNPAWGGLALGTMAGAGSAGLKIFKNMSSDPTAGYYPGGVSQVPERSGRKMGANFLSTTGLTLSLHKHGRSTPRVL